MSANRSPIPKVEVEACYRHGLLLGANGTFEAENGDDYISCIEEQVEHVKHIAE